MTLVVGWALTGLTIVVAAVLAGRSRRALRVGLAAVAFSLAGLGAVGLAVLVATDTATPRYTQAIISRKMVLTSSSPLDLHWPMPDRTPQCCGQACRGYVLTNRWHSAMRRTIL